MGNGAERHEEGDVDASGIVEDCANDLLDAEAWRFIDREGQLGVFAIFLGWTIKGCQLGENGTLHVGFPYRHNHS